MNSAEKKQISVIIPYYKSEKTILKSMESAVHQKDVDVEILLVCDGDKISDPDILAYINKHPEINKIELPQNKGVANARNVGVRHAKGEYIAFLDADDWWEKDKLKKQMKVFETKKPPLICFTGRRLCTYQGEYTGRYIHAKNHVIYKDLLKSNYINCSSVVIKRNILLRYPMKNDDLHEDYICWLEILKGGGYAEGIDEPLLNYRVSEKSKSGNKFKSAVMTYKVYKKIGLSFAKRIYYMVHYTINGLKKYY